MINCKTVNDKKLLRILEKIRSDVEDKYDTHCCTGTITASLFNDLDDTVNIHTRNTGNVVLDSASEVNEVKDEIGASRCSNASIYTPDFLMDWHTNSNHKGRRVYISYSYGDTIFRYKSDAGIKDIIEPKNKWVIKCFTIPTDGLFWHCVATNSYRITLGFVI